MSKTKLLVVIIAVALLFAEIYLFTVNKKGPLKSPIAGITKEAAPSQTLTEYSDPSGFTISYPDNLSIDKKEAADQSTYADIQLSSKDVSGSLSLKIADSKYVSLEDWAKENTKSTDVKETKLGNLKASEIKLSDRLLLGALDQGILFTVEMPLIEEKFWNNVYSKVLASFSFAAPEAASDGNASSSDDVSFEGEEVVE